MDTLDSTYGALLIGLTIGAVYVTIKIPAIGNNTELPSGYMVQP